jgi:hypothetical protein
MSTDPYKVSPGDLITAKLFNGLQDKITHDTDEQIKKAIDGITKVQAAGDAEKFGGKSPDEVEKTIIDQVLAKLAKRTGYRLVFKRLQPNEWDTVTHDLGAFPLVDAYQLDYFNVVCADGEDKENKFVNFYLYHSTETELRSAVQGDKQKLFIEKSDGSEFVFKIKFEEMLKWFEIPYSNNSQSISDLVAEFWQQLFKKPNDKFDVDQYCNSPWFEKCCGDNRSIGILKQRDDWDELWFQMRARKTINFHPLLNGQNNVSTPIPPVEWPAIYPNNIEVVQLDFNNIGVRLIGRPFYAPTLITADAPNNNNFNRDELKVMLLLKV